MVQHREERGVGGRDRTAAVDEEDLGPGGDVEEVQAPQTGEDRGDPGPDDSHHRGGSGGSVLGFS